MSGNYSDTTNKPSTDAQNKRARREAPRNVDAINLHKTRNPLIARLTSHPRSHSAQQVETQKEDFNCDYSRTTPVSMEDERNETNSDKNDDEQKPSSIAFFASNSTFHGISHFVGGPFSFRKALWAAAFFSSFGGLLTQVYDRYTYYQSHPHVTKLDEQEAAEMSFPAITICNMNPFRFSQVTTDDYFYVGGTLLGLFKEDYTLIDDIPYNGTWATVRQRVDRILRNGKSYRPDQTNFNMFEFYDRTGHKFSGIIKQCKYRGELCDIGQWIPTYTRYGKCYTFNSGKKKDVPILKTLKGGVDNGLEILLDTEQNDYMPVWNETDEISVEAGFKVQIHVQAEPPFIHELGFGISPGFQSLVATQEQRITFLPSPYGECESGSNKTKHKQFDNYSISACRITCETNYVVRKCQCRMIHMPGNASFCSPEDYKSCADAALDFLVNSDEKECVCGTPCEVTRYNLEMSTLQIPSTQAVSYLATKYGKTEEYVRNNFAKLNVFFEALNYETIDQKKAYELPGLFGDIGGQMGLFIGASILTILELVDYLYEVVKDKTWGKKIRKERRRNISTGSSKNEEADTDGSQVYGHQNYSAYEPRHNDRRAFAPYNQLSSLPEYSQVRKRPTVVPEMNPHSENRLMMQTFGNSYEPPYNGVKIDDKAFESSFTYKPTTLHPPSSRGKKEHSMSYNDLYSDFGNNWSADNCLNRSQMSTNAMGYTLPPAGASGKYFRPLENEVYSHADLPKPPHQNWSPTNAIASDFPDYPSTKETEIH